MQWSTRRAETLVLVAVGVLLSVGVLLVDAPGRVLVGAAAALVLGIAVRDLLARPRLSAGPDGIRVRGATGHRHLPWAGLQIRVREARRLGFRTRTLELDTAAGPGDDGVLVVLGRRDLGADPGEVALALLSLDPAGR